MSVPQTYQEDFSFPQPPPRELILGGHNATLVEITRPQPSSTPNERGEHPMTSIFKWAIDGYTDLEPQWSYVNVESRGERSNFYKVYKALTGDALQVTTNVEAKKLVGLRCQLLLEESTTKPGFARVSGYLPIPKPRTPRVVAPAPPPPPPSELFFDEEEENIDPDKVPF